MESWTLQFTAAQFFLDFAWLGALLIVGTLLRKKIPFLQKYLIPANLLAGTVGLFIGMNGLGWIDLTSDRLGVYVYHLLALLFIALGLRAPKKRLGLSSVKFGLIFISSYLIQAIIGLVIAFILIYTIMPDLFAGIGLLAPLSFGMNPGIAFSIGQNWEQFGFQSGGIVGLTFAAFGFLAAYTMGIWLVRAGIKNGEAKYVSSDEGLSDDVRSGLVKNPVGNSEEKITTSPESIESFTFHIGLIGFTYVITYGVLKVMEAGLVWIGSEQEITTLWSFHFIAAAIIAISMRKGFDLIQASKYIDDVTMTRCSNLFMDFMIVASVAAISFAVVAQYWIPLLGISVFAIFATWLLIQMMTKSAFNQFRLERFAVIFGNMTGTLQSGLVLLRILDPTMKSPVSFNLVYGSGLALIFGFPLLILINAPVHYFSDINEGFLAVLFTLVLYLGLISFFWQYLRKPKKQ
jgi:glutamate:Na+ symporter, ESS family